jgi:hypothetical protein
MTTSIYPTITPSCWWKPASNSCLSACGALLLLDTGFRQYDDLGIRQYDGFYLSNYYSVMLVETSIQSVV